MRLLYVVHDLEQIGGLSRSAVRMIEHFRKAGHEVGVVPAIPEGSGGARRFHEQASGHAMQRWTRRTLVEIDRFRPDLVVGYYGSRGAFTAASAAALAGVPSVACLRGNDVNLDFFSPTRQHLVRFAVERAHAVTVVSREMQRKVARWFGVQSTFISNSVDVTKFAPDPDGARRLRSEWNLPDRPVVGLFGEFKPAKGLQHLAVLRDALQDAKTVIVGEVRQDSRRDVPDWVQVVPYVADLPTLCAAYTVCDLVLVPSVEEGMPNTVLEAMACERVVLASPTGGIVDLIRDGSNGFLCGRDEWPLRVAHLLSKPAPEVGIAARRSVPTPDQEADAFRTVFERVVGERAGLRQAGGPT